MTLTDDEFNSLLDDVDTKVQAMIAILDIANITEISKPYVRQGNVWLVSIKLKGQKK